MRWHVAGSLALVLASAASAHAEVKQQVFVGAGVTVPRGTGASSTSVSGGYALIIPLADGWAVRPLASVAQVNPTTSGRPPFPSVLGGALLIRRVTPTFSLLGGGGMNTLIRDHAPNERLAVAIISTNSRISNRWVLLTPLVISKTGIGFNAQFALNF
jgi:hypothetical protein